MRRFDADEERARGEAQARERQMTWLIDDRGVAWPSSMHRIAGWSARSDPLGFAVSDMGFICLRGLKDGMTVSFNPSRTRQRTMISAFYLIASERPRRIALLYGGEYSCHEI